MQNNSSYNHNLRLWDFQNSNFSLKKEELEQIYEQASKTDNKPGKLAIPISGDLAFGLARMYEAYGSTSFTEVDVFRDQVEAEAWC